MEDKNLLNVCKQVCYLLQEQFLHFPVVAPLYLYLRV